MSEAAGLRPSQRPRPQLPGTEDRREPHSSTTSATSRTWPVTGPNQPSAPPRAATACSATAGRNRGVRCRVTDVLSNWLGIDGGRWEELTHC